MNHQTKITPDNLKTALFAQLEQPFTGEELFDCLTDLVFFIKNSNGEYVVVNNELVSRCGKKDKTEIIGRKADDVYPKPLGQVYRLQDESVINTGEPILNQLEMQIYHAGNTGWCITNKIPLKNRKHQVVGLVGISRDLQAPNEKGKNFAQAAMVIRHIQTHYGETLKVSELAKMAGFSHYQFEERIRKLFQITAGQFILKVRMDAAVRHLRETNQSVALVAQECGYSDQSAFTRQFRQTVGITPSQFRQAQKGRS